MSSNSKIKDIKGWKTYNVSQNVPRAADISIPGWLRGTRALDKRFAKGPKGGHFKRRKGYL